MKWIVLSYMKKITQICKRDGRIVEFDLSKITKAIFQAAKAVGIEDYDMASRLSEEVFDRLNRQYTLTHENPSVEKIQDMVEEVLVKNGHYQIVKASAITLYDTSANTFTGGVLIDEINIGAIDAAHITYKLNDLIIQTEKIIITAYSVQVNTVSVAVTISEDV